MRVEEIAMRQEIRQMLNEAGLNRETIREMAKAVLKEEVKKQVEYSVHRDIKQIVKENMYGIQFRNALEEGIKQVVREQMNIDIDVRVRNTENK